MTNSETSEFVPVATCWRGAGFGSVRARSRNLPHGDVLPGAAIGVAPRERPRGEPGLWRGRSPVASHQAQVGQRAKVDPPLPVETRGVICASKK